MFSFLPPIYNLVTIELSFLLLSILAIISTKTINILRFLFGLQSSMFLSIFNILFEYSINTFEALKCFVPASSRFLINNWYIALFRSLAYK